MTAAGVAGTGRFDAVAVGLGVLLPGTSAVKAVLEGAGLDDAAAVEHLRTLTLQEMHRHLRRSARWRPGIEAGVARLSAAGLRTFVVTEEPAVLADYAARWGLAEPVAAPARVQDGRIVALEPRFDPAAATQRRLHLWGVPWERLCHVADPARDAPLPRAGAVVPVGARGEREQVRDFAAVVDEMLLLHRGGK